MKVIQEVPLPHLELTGLEADLSDEERSILETAHRFAEQVMRPAGRELDRMTAEEVVADGSPLFDFLKQFAELGLSPVAIAGMEPPRAARLLPLVAEELGWGDAGLTITAVAGSFPAFAAALSGDPELVDIFGTRPGCWVATQPERGSDVADVEGMELNRGDRHNVGSLRARVTDSEVILDGQSSAWVSGAPIAQTGLVYCAADYGDGHLRDDGTIHGVAVLVPFDLPGVSKGKPLEKIGQRPLPQGEIFFENVRVPLKFVVAGKDQFRPSFFTALTFGNMEMSSVFTGLGRAAYDHALGYAHERKQGGRTLIGHQTVRLRLFEMWRKLESARALARRITAYNFLGKTPHVLASITGKVHCTQMAFEVAHEALQMFGGNGLTREYPLEKLLRDARAALIEDGDNYILSLIASNWLSRAWQDRSGA